MIDQHVVFLPVLVFIVFFIVHVAVWRTLRPKRQILALFVVFLILPLFLMAASVVSLSALNIRVITTEDLLLIFLFYLGLAGCYIQTFPAIQAWSPSLYIVYRIGKGNRARSFSEIIKIVKPDMLIGDRFKDLVDEGLIKVDDRKKVSLTPKGNLLAVVFILYRGLLGLKAGEG